MPETDPAPGLSIADAVASLREQIHQATAAAEGESLSFDVRGIQLELQLTVTTTFKGDAKLSLWNVVSLGGGADRASAATHKVTLTLEPNHDGQGGRTRIADRG